MRFKESFHRKWKKWSEDVERRARVEFPSDFWPEYRIRSCWLFPGRPALT